MIEKNNVRIWENKDTSAIEQELVKYIDDVPKVPGFVENGLESESRIFSFVRNMKTEIT
jgi:hypothetical protein